MPLTAPVYCTREDVKGAVEIAASARANDSIDRAIETARDAVEGLLRRRFNPWTGTRYFRWPNPGSPTPWRLWLDADEVVTVTALTAGGATIATPDRLLEPANSGPPFTHIEIDQSSSSAYAPGSTSQRAIAVTGTFGYRTDEETVGELTGSLTSSATATSSAAWTTARIGVGSLLRIDNERVLVVERTMVDSTQNTQTALTAQTSAVTVTVSDPTAFALEEIILVGAERMRVVDIAGNDLTVKRAWDGTVLAAHNSGVDIYTLTGVQILRGQCGTTAATHDTDAVIYRHVIPAAVRDLAVAYAVNQLAQEGAAYARVVGSGDSAMEASGKGLRAAQQDALERHGRQILMGAV